MRRRAILMAAAATILAVQAVASYTLTRDPYLPSPPPLLSLPLQMDAWTQVQDGVIEPEVQQMLGPDDVLSREYVNAGRKQGANLFIAYYKSQLRSRNA